MNGLAGLPTLARFALRRDRIMISAWVLALAVTAYASVDAARKLYPTAASRLAIAAGASASKVTTAMYGPASDVGTLGGLATWKLNALGAVLVAVMSIAIVVRHTRGDEDAGRTELIGAGAVGRSATMGAGLVTAMTAALAVGLASAAALTGGGLPGGASLAFGLGLTAAGWVFAALTAVVAQIAGSARATMAGMAGLLGLAYIMRAVGDTAPPSSPLTVLSALSPIGWSERVRPFGPLNWWELAIPLAVTAVAAGAAVALSAGRDLGEGLLPARRGRPTAGASLAGPFGLAWRLQRGTLAAWAAGFAVYGLFIGALADSVATLVGNSASARHLFAELGGHQGLTNAFLAASMGIMGVLAAVYAISAVLRLRSEESAGRAEAVLATRVSRIRLALTHLLFALAGPVLLLALVGLAAGLVHAARDGGGAARVGEVLASALVQVPAVWVLAGLALALDGLLPRLTALAWAGLVGCLLLGELGSLLGLSHWALDLSAFSHVPKLPGAAFSPTPLAWLAAAAAVMVAAGLTGLRRRDVG